MLLLTGATGEVGSALLPRLLADGYDVRCLVRDPRRLGTQRVHVQIALGDLTDPPSFRNAMRGVDTVLHLAATIRDQPQGSIEECNAIASWRMVQAARHAGVHRFLFFSVPGASRHHRSRFFRAKALAEQAVVESGLRCVVFSPSLIYAPKDRWLTLIERLSLAGITPIVGDGKALFQPIWVHDVAQCVIAVLRADAAHAHSDEVPLQPLRYELAGPETLSQEEIVRTVLRSLQRPELLLRVPAPILTHTLRLLERLSGPSAFATPDEAELLEISTVSRSGAADARSLGVDPRPLQHVLGVSSELESLRSG